MSTHTARPRATSGRSKGGDPAKRRVILDAAIGVFLREGYERAAVDAIADEAGVAKQTVYNHFGDKERLFLAAVEQERTRITEQFAASEPQSAVGKPERDPGAELIVIARRVLGVLLDDRITALRRLVIGQVAHHPSLRAAYLDDEPVPLVGRLADTFRTRTARGELWIGEPSIAARQFIGLLMQQGTARSKYGTQRLSADECETICRQTVGLFLRAYRVPVRPVGPAGNRLPAAQGRMVRR